MLKRILAIALGMFLGSLLALGGAQAWIWLRGGSERELQRSSAYVREIMELVRSDYVEPGVEIDTMTHAALRGLLESLDPHSQFMDARDYTNLREDIDSEFGGIGVQVEFVDDSVIVIAPIAGTPGERAGIRRGDRIVRIDGEAMTGRGMNAVVNRLRGKPGTEVVVGLRRAGAEDDVEVTIERQRIRVESVTDVMVDADGIGYLRLSQFSEPTADELRRALATLHDEGMRALVFDLRNNPGGLLTAAAAVAEQFLPEGEMIVYTQGRHPDDQQEFFSTNRGEGVDVPVAVLINAGSASAAEIVAGALQVAHKAVVVGERSFGKGSVQSIYRLRRGEALRLTTAKYFLANGETIHERGVLPDVDIVMSPEDDANIALQRARSDITDSAEFERRFGFVPVADRQYDAAKAILQASLLVEERKVAGR